MASPTSFVARIGIPKFGSAAGLTGFLVSPDYAITCAHAAIEPADLRRQPLSVEEIGLLQQVQVDLQFDDGSSATGTTIAYGPPDCALIRLDKPVLRDPVRLIANLRVEHEALMIRHDPHVIGFSANAAGGLKTSSVREIVGSLRPFESTDLLDFQISAGLPMEMSGSPAVVRISGVWLCIGMAYLGGAGSATSRLVSSPTLLEFLGRHGVNCLPAADANDCFRAQQSEVATDAQEERHRFLEYVTFAGRFSNLPDAISLPDVYVHRTEQEQDIHQMIARDRIFAKGSWLSIQGSAGSGKSSLLWCLYQDLSRTEGTIVQPFAAQFLSDNFKREESIVAYRASVSQGKKCVVLIDTLDLIVGRGDRDLISFISALQARGVSLVTTCRPLEAQRLSSLHVPAHIIPLGRYSKPESIVAVSKYVARAYPSLTQGQQAAQEQELWNLLDGKRRVQELSFEPLILRMIFEVYPPDPIPADINTALVYSAYWQRCVIQDRLRNFDSATERQRDLFASRLADIILFSNETSFGETSKVSEFEVAWRAFDDRNPFPYDILDSLRSSGVIEEASNGTIRFFHQTMLEFAAARHIVRAPGRVQEERINRILSDLQGGVFLRAPVLVQIAVQDAQAGGNTWIEILKCLLQIGSLAHCYFSLEILGKLPENDATARAIATSRIVERWTEEHLDRIAACAVDTVGQYPKSRIAFGLTILEHIIQTEETNEIFSLAARLASIAPKAVLDFLSRTLSFMKDRESSDGEARGQYRSALLSCADAGEADAIRILGEIFPYLHEGQRQGTLRSLPQRVTPANVDAIGDFLQAIKYLLFGNNANQIMDDYLKLLTKVHRTLPDTAVRIANDLIKSDSPKRLDDAARLIGWLRGAILKNPATIPQALEDITSSDHLRRMAAAVTLLFSDPAEQDGIIDRFLSLDLPALTTAARGSLFSVVADLPNSELDRVMRFIASCPWPESAAGKAWRSIAARLATVWPWVFKEWLLQRLDENQLSRMIAVGLSQLMLAQPAMLSEQEVKRVFKSALKSDVRSLGSFAQATGAIATVNPTLASQIVDQLIKPRHCEVWATLAFSMHGALRENRAWISDTVPYLISAAVRRGDNGTMSKLLEGLREWPEDHGIELAQLLEVNLTEDILRRFPEEKCQVEYLLLIRTISREAPDRAFKLLGRAIIQTPGTAGAAASAASNIARHTDDEALLKTLLDRLLQAAPNGVQATTRFAIQVGLSSIDEKLGHRCVVESFFNMYTTIENPEALKRLISAVNDLPSWAAMDTERLLRDLEHIRGSVRSHVLKLKKKLKN